MTHTNPPPPQSPYPKRRIAYEPMPMPFSGGRGKSLMFASVVVGCAGLAVYMYFVQHMPAMDPRVIAPAVGALWFGVRLFMTLTPKL
ncbi:MAG: hypothetical protein QM759_02515 [Terricaulis sp.]